MTPKDDLKHCSFCDKSSLQVKQLVAGPNLNRDTVYICNECIQIAYRATNASGKTAHSHKNSSFTPQEIVEHLDRWVIGQHSAKQILSVAVYNHFKRHRVDHDKCQVDKSNVLLIGPSGSGKTLLVRTLAEILDVPFVQVDATVFTETGYVGEDADTIAAMLLDEADGEVEQAQQGIVLIDEIDKRSRRSGQTSTSKDVSGEGVQQALLKLIEGKPVKVKTGSGGEVTVDTTQVLFVAAGAFVGLQDRHKQGIGFCVQPEQQHTDILPDDLIEYGLIPEFVGRFPVIATVETLTESALVQVLTEPHSNLTEQYRTLFELDSVKLEFDHDYLCALARKTLDYKTGARGLRSLLEKDLLAVQFRLPELKQQGITHVNIQADGTPTYYTQGKNL